MKQTGIAEPKYPALETNTAGLGLGNSRSPLPLHKDVFPSPACLSGASLFIHVWYVLGFGRWFKSLTTAVSLFWSSVTCFSQSNFLKRLPGHGPDSSLLRLQPSFHLSEGMFGLLWQSFDLPLVCGHTSILVAHSLTTLVMFLSLGN